MRPATEIQIPINHVEGREDAIRMLRGLAERIADGRIQGTMLRFTIDVDVAYPDLQSLRAMFAGDIEIGVEVSE